MLPVARWDIDDWRVSAFEVGLFKSLDSLLNIPRNAHVNVSLLFVVVQGNTNILLCGSKVRGDCVKFTECTQQMFYSAALFEFDQKIVNHQGESNSVSAVPNKHGVLIHCMYS